MTLKEKINNSSYTQVTLAEEVGCSRSTIQRTVKNPSKYPEIVNSINELLSEDKKPLTKAPVETITYKNGKLEAKKIINANPANLTLDEIVEQFDLDLTKWECTKYEVGSWNTSMKLNEGTIEDTVGTIKNYTVRAVFVPRNGFNLSKKNDLGWIYKSLKEYKPAIKGPNLKVQHNNVQDNMLLLPIFDLHFGKLTWEDETGSHYDIKIARKRFMESIKELLDRASISGFSKIIFPIGNDFFNVNSANGTTAKGTPQDNDTRYKRIIRDGIDLLLDAINLCREYAFTEVIWVPGNHDVDSSFAAYEAVRGWLNNVPNVKVSDDVKARKYIMWGINLLGLTHGNEERDRIYELMQQEAREYWGKTKYAEWIIGHYHRSYVDEKHGVRKVTVSSLSGTDAWHYTKGYTGSLKGAQARLYRKDRPGPYTVFYYYL